MIIKLPLCIDEKIIFSNFIIKKINDNYIINLFNRNYEEKIEKIKVPLCNNFQGISYLDIFLPLELTIINNKIFFPYFMQKIYLSQNDLPIDFFFNIENQIKQLNISFIKKEELSKMEMKIWKYCTSFNENINLENSLDTIKRLWEVAQINLNSSLYLLSLYPDFTNKSIKDYQKKHNISKKLISITNAMKTIKYSINDKKSFIKLRHVFEQTLKTNINEILELL
jgi:hypothetical protein